MTALHPRRDGLGTILLRWKFADMLIGILKNSSYHSDSPTSPDPQILPSGERPGPDRKMSEKEIVLQNTLHNAGPAHRRTSSTHHGLSSRRSSGTLHGGDYDENSPRLKWDEANLYLTEQQRDSTMKITEPKTPYAGTYDPAEDEDEISALNAQELIVDELDAAKGKKPPKDDEIPGLDIGEPEATLEHTQTPESEKRVIVDTDMTDEGRHGEEAPDMSEDERQKHREFEEMRRKHYEMKNIRNLLGYAPFVALYQ